MGGGSIAPASLPSPPPAAAVNFPPISSSGGGGGASSMYIVFGLLAFSIIVIFIIRCLKTSHCEVTCCNWQWRHPSAVADVPLTPLDGRSTSISSKGDVTVSSEKEKSATTDGRRSSFSLTTLSPECAVCLSPLLRGEELRLLPACGHAFHAPCVDTWIRTTPSCPICRSSVTLPVPPTFFIPTPPVSGRWHLSRSGSFRIDSGRENRTDGETRRPNPTPVSQPSVPLVMRTYSIGLTEEEVETIVAQIGRRPTEKKDNPSGSTLSAPPTQEAAEFGGVSSGGRSGRWLWDYIERFASSASSSTRFSGRWSRRYDGDGWQQSWDLEGSRWREEEDGITYSFYKWLMGE